MHLSLPRWCCRVTHSFYLQLTEVVREVDKCFRAYSLPSFYKVSYAFNLLDRVKEERYRDHTVCVCLQSSLLFLTYFMYATWSNTHTHTHHTPHTHAHIPHTHTTHTSHTTHTHTPHTRAYLKMCSCSCCVQPVVMYLVPAWHFSLNHCHTFDDLFQPGETVSPWCTYFIFKVMSILWCSSKLTTSVILHGQSLSVNEVYISQTCLNWSRIFAMAATPA